MPAIRVLDQGDSNNAVSGLKFSKQANPFLATLAAAGVTVGDDIGFSVGSEDYLLNADVNLESSADIVRFLEDRILDREPAQDGEIFIPVNVTTALGFQLNVEEVI